jgi:hypothetical protein
MSLFSTGNSGNILLEAVVKRGLGCQQEGAFCQVLGPDVAPVVYALLDNGYVMERLAPARRHVGSLREIEDLLERRVWRRAPLPSSLDKPWQEELAKFGIEIPDWILTEDECLVHGDPTHSNMLIRRGGQIILGDPRPPRAFLPQRRETDMGRIVQSMLGWEVAAYGAEIVSFDPPWFMKDDYYRKAAYFWAGAAATRIQFLERTKPNPSAAIWQWCDYMKVFCAV